MIHKQDSKFKKNDCVKTHFRKADKPTTTDSYSKKQTNTKALESLHAIEKKIGEVSNEINNLEHADPPASSIRSINFVKQHIVGLEDKKEIIANSLPTNINTTVVPEIKKFIEKQKKNSQSRRISDISGSEIQKIDYPLSPISQESEKNQGDYEVLLQNFKQNFEDPVHEISKSEVKRMEAPTSKIFYNEPTIKKVEVPTVKQITPQKEPSADSNKKSMDDLMIENATLKEKIKILEREKEALRNDVVKLTV
jgi:hypothetical protein